MAVITNDIYTQEDAQFLIRRGALPAERVIGVETGGCPHTAIREDASVNLEAVHQLLGRFPGLELLFVESGGDNLAATFSPELVDATIYVIDVAEGDKIPRKGGPGITRSDLLVINKIDLAPYVGRRPGGDGARRQAHERRAGRLSSPISATATGPRPSPTGSAASSSSSPEPAAPRASAATASSCSGSSGAAAAPCSPSVAPRCRSRCSRPWSSRRAGPPSCSSIPTGGVVGGDRLETRVRLGAGSRVCLTTPSATRVYRSAGQPAVQRFRATVGPGGRLEYVPDHLIPSPGARLRQCTELVLAAGASALVLGRLVGGAARAGEPWAFAELDLRSACRDADGPILRERACLGGRRFWDGLGGAEGMAYVGDLCRRAVPRRRIRLGRGTQWEACGWLTARAGGARRRSARRRQRSGRGGVLARVLAPPRRLCWRRPMPSGPRAGGGCMGFPRCPCGSSRGRGGSGSCDSLRGASMTPHEEGAGRGGLDHASPPSDGEGIGCAEYAERAAAAIGLPLDPARRRRWAAARVMLAAAALVLEFPLPDEVEAAPVFEP